MANLVDYDYLLPKKNLALEPSILRDSSRLFIYDTKTDKITFDRFHNLDKYLPKDSFLVLNNTKVLPARVIMNKKGGGKVILLFLVNELAPDCRRGRSSRVIRAIIDRKINIGDKLFFPDGNFVETVGQKENIFDFKLYFSKEKLFSLLQKFGTMPIPPYLKKSTLTRDELIKKYQTIFATVTPTRCNMASAAAPTASLHFTNNVFDKLKEKGIEKYFITLHVGLGTFAPISEENIKQKKLHEEYFEIDEKILLSINTLKKKEKKLVAVGTTVVRTLESISRRGKHDFFTFEGTPTKSEVRLSCDKNYATEPNNIFGKTDLFIFPPYDFKMVDIMITNFHLPKSSLMMLIEAFLQHKKAKHHLVDLYNVAIKNNFRFYSFGDAMVIK